jgi:hypothetical protein
MAKGLPNFYRGDTVKLALEFTAEDGSGAPVDITGWVITTTLKSSLALADDAAAWRISQTAPANAQSTAGQIVLVIPSTVSGAVNPGLYWIDIERRIPGAGGDPDDVLTVLVQEIECMADVTRSPP